MLSDVGCAPARSATWSAPDVHRGRGSLPLCSVCCRMSDAEPTGWRTVRSRPHRRSERCSARRSESEVETKCFVEFRLQFCVEHADSSTEAFHGDRAHVLRLRLRVSREACDARRQEDLKRVDAIGVRRDWHDSDDASPEALRNAVGAVVADDDRWTLLVGFCTSDGFEVDEPDLTSAHQAVRPLPWTPTAHGRRPPPTLPTRLRRRRSTPRRAAVGLLCGARPISRRSPLARRTSS